ncbi:MAG: 23S rRNA (pseudouridine(1915)-N(3))-methyltransferase RlmH [Desulfohalobiaceae bacterium]
MQLKFVWIGKLRKRFWLDAAAHYAGRLKHRYRLEEICLKDGSASLRPESRAGQEGADILKRISRQDMVISLDRKGRLFTSRQLSSALSGWVETPGRTPCFVIGGAYGLSRDVVSRSDLTLSLGPMTLPHELARVVLLEQLYRADAILRNLPYHH